MFKCVTPLLTFSQSTIKQQIDLYIKKVMYTIVFVLQLSYV